MFAAAVLGWGIKMGMTNFTSARFYAFSNSRARRSSWLDEANARNGGYGESSGPRLLPFTDSENGNNETEDAAVVPGNDTPTIESPLINPDARDLSSLEGRDLTGQSPWGDNA